MKRLLTIVWLLFALHLQAQLRSGEKEARATAEQFVLQQGKQVKQILSLSEEIKSEPSGQTNLFVFAIEPKGYVIVSAMNEVLAYSFSSSMPASDELPDHIAYWIDLYNEQTDYLLQHPDLITKPTKQQRSVGPLVTSVWGQGCYHNEACPVDSSGPCQHVSAGCVAIAMAQIMYYHKQPLVGNGTISYNCSPYGTLSADFGQTTYHWEEMVDTLHESNPAVAQLIYHCGVSVQMEYGAQSSSSSSLKAAKALQEFFVYPSADYLSKSNYTNEEWTTMVRKDLDIQLPVYYGGYSSLGGHAFVCDGYDTNGLFHFNFGWDGVADGYYTLDSPYGFSVTQSIIRDICQEHDIPIHSDEHGIIYVTPDGTGDGSSWDQATSKLQFAIIKSHTGSNSIWVKEGTYTGVSKDAYNYNIAGDCQIYGGFEGNEHYDYDLSLRNFEEHPTILDGNHLRGVINVSTESSSSILIDGFIIQNGKASYGGGIFTNNDIHIKNCTFRSNYANLFGGAFSNFSSDLSVYTLMENCEFYGNDASYGGAIYDCGNSTYSHCQFHDNFAKKDGGAIVNNRNSTYSHCQFHDNHAEKFGGAIRCGINNNTDFINCVFNNNTAQNGGAIYNADGHASFWSCLINNNTAETGGGCYNYNIGSIRLFNCTIVKNEAQNNYGGVYSYYGSMKNCIIWGNESQGEVSQIGPINTYTYCAIQNDPSGSEFNFDAATENDGESPGFYIRFKCPDVVAGSTGYGGDWRLQMNSYCIDKGITISGQTATDLDGNPRIWNDTVDLGAYEISIVNMQEEICESDDYDLFGMILNEAGHYSTIIGCIVYELDLTVNPLHIIPLEEGICEGETYDFFGTLLNETGNYTYSTIDCNTYELDLTVNPLPVLICSSDTVIEQGQSVQLTVTGADTYLWSTGETTETITVSPTMDTTYFVTGFSHNGCSTTAHIIVRVNTGCEELDGIEKPSLYPNPANDKVEIFMPLIDEVQVFNLMGVRIDHVKAERKIVELNTSAYPPGVYVVHIRQLNNHTYAKLIIQH